MIVSAVPSTTLAVRGLPLFSGEEQVKSLWKNNKDYEEEMK